MVSERSASGAEGSIQLTLIIFLYHRMDINIRIHYSTYIVHKMDGDYDEI